MATKYIFITGGVVSGLGKGITAASLGRLLKCRGLSVTSQKLDPYLNVDPGTMNPIQHGEVFVTDDGIETDLDLGHYERFIDENLNRHCSVTSGSVYWSVLNKERNGDYDGGTVQVIPHITNEIKDHIAAGKENYDVAIVEIGGTVGDIEGLPFLEAIRQFSMEIGRENCLFVHVTLVPYISASGELKTKPTQHSVKVLLSEGIQPDIIVCRTQKPITDDIKRKISLFCNVNQSCVVENSDMKYLYEVPMALHKEKLDDIVVDLLNLNANEIDLTEWTAMLDKLKSPKDSVTIGMVGKYVSLPDAYISVEEALKHGGIDNGVSVNVDYIDSETITEQNVGEKLGHLDGILVPGGFGTRGIEGKIIAAKYARENNVPYFGICLGMQIASIEFARDVLGYKDATSAEFDSKSQNQIIHIMPEQEKVKQRGGTMRMGSYPCHLDTSSKSYSVYGKSLIHERHRHRYEFNNKYRDEFIQHGALFAGTSPDDRIVEILELPNHPWFIGVQFHPEFTSRPNRPNPLFRGFIGASYKYKKSKQ